MKTAVSSLSQNVDDSGSEFPSFLSSWQGTEADIPKHTGMVLPILDEWDNLESDLTFPL